MIAIERKKPKTAFSLHDLQYIPELPFLAARAVNVGHIGKSRKLVMVMAGTNGVEKVVIVPLKRAVCENSRSKKLATILLGNKSDKT